MWNSSPGRISYLAVLSSQGSHGLTRLARSVEPWAEDDARDAARVAGGFVLDDLEEVTEVKPLRRPPGPQHGCCGLVAASSRALSTLVFNPPNLQKVDTS
jgi:hypothetical protein